MSNLDLPESTVPPTTTTTTTMSRVQRPRRLSSTPPLPPSKRARIGPEQEDEGETPPPLASSSRATGSASASGSGSARRGEGSGSARILAIGATDFSRDSEREPLRAGQWGAPEGDAGRRGLTVGTGVPINGVAFFGMRTMPPGGSGGGREAGDSDLEGDSWGDNDDDDEDEDATPLRVRPAVSHGSAYRGSSVVSLPSPPPAPLFVPSPSPPRPPTPTIDLTTHPSPPHPSRDPSTTTSLSELTCPICLGPPVPLALTSCGHAFCAPCLNASLVAGPPLSPPPGGTGGIFVQRGGSGSGEGELDKHCPVCRTVLRGGWGKSLRGLVVRMGEVRQVVG